MPRQRFTGQARDGEAGLDDFNARAYQPLFGRFTRPDPISGNVYAPQSWNAYAYVQNRPLVATDPSGLVERLIFRTTSEGCADCPSGAGGERAAPSSSDPLSFDMWVLTNTFFPTSWQQADSGRQRDRPNPRLPKTPDPTKPGESGGTDSSGSGNGSDSSNGNGQDTKKQEEQKDPEKPYGDCVMVCIEQERFNLGAMFATLAGQLELGTMAKTAHEAKQLGNDNPWTNQLSRRALREGDRTWRVIGRTTGAKVLGGSLLSLTVFEGYYNIGAIGRCCWVCGKDSSRY